MNANKTTPTPEARVHKYEVIKYNKHSTIYQSCDVIESTELVTPVVKIEVFQKFSNAYNLGLYFRIKNASNWVKSTLVTGLFKTTRLNHFYGDFITNEGKTLLLFRIDEVNALMYVYEYSKGYYPSSNIIQSLINQL